MSEAHSNRHNYLFRLTADQRGLLGQRASAEGLSIQEFLELAALGTIRPRAKGGRPFKIRDQEVLPLDRAC